MPEETWIHYGCGNWYRIGTSAGRGFRRGYGHNGHYGYDNSGGHGDGSSGAMYIAMTTAIAVAPAQATATAKASDSATGMTFHGAQSMIEEALLSFGNGFGDGFISYGHVDSGQGFSFCEPEGRGYGCGPHYGYMMLSGQGCGLGSAYNLQGAINTNGGLGHGDYLGFAWTIF